jgi:2-polyprenyl-3-methyl-5-hydroxy-6-metoxy-1,4-benzoquinol methylase
MKTIEEWNNLPYDERKKWLDVSYRYYHKKNRFGGREYSLEVLNLIKKHKFQTLLDYGTGNGGMSTYTDRKILNLADRKVKVKLYDPYSNNPNYRFPPASHHKFDLVSCTDVLEHILPEDIDDVIWALVRSTKKMLFCTVACYPASKRIVNEKGKEVFEQSLHTIVQPRRWWEEKFDAAQKRLYDEEGRWITLNVLYT